MPRLSFGQAFLYIGTNVLYITLDAGVWFIAQNFALTLSLMAIFYALENKGGFSLFFGDVPLDVDHSRLYISQFYFISYIKI